MSPPAHLVDLSMSSMPAFPTSSYYLGPSTIAETPLEEQDHSVEASSNAVWHEAHRWNGLFRNGLPTPPISKAMTGVTLKNNYANGSVSQTHQLPQYQRYDASATSIGREERPGIVRDRTSLRLDGLLPKHASSTSRDLSVEHRSELGNMIASSFQIPESVNSSKGSIAEFAAEITCLFWFESAATLRYAEDLPGDAYPDRGLVSDAMPSIGFRKWVTTILTTTLVSKNVILLALLFIYRLKKFNPGVSGKRGSEFRLLTIALMLGNKFLDDNTYTNKTWAEVSGISVTEIHIMEVEFLSNMRYNLFVSESEWRVWKVKLGHFGAFFERAAKLPAADVAATPITPLTQSFPQKLPSPPSTHHHPISYVMSQRLNAGHQPLPNPFSTAPHLPRSPVHLDQGQQSRKRSLDISSELPPAKRSFHSDNLVGQPSTATPESLAYTPGTVTSYTPQSSIATSSPVHMTPLNNQRVPRLPMPRIQTTNQLGDTHPASHSAPLSLPNSRAMSTVYPPTSANWHQQLAPSHTASIPNVNLYSNPVPSLGDIGRARSTYGSATASPIAATYSTGTPTRPGLSPSYFLTNRSSPYRPVRGVNTLLIPPPSTSLNNPSRSIGHDQIHYQPLSKSTTERRSGVVPYLMNDPWSQAHTPMPH